MGLLRRSCSFNCCKWRDIVGILQRLLCESYEEYRNLVKIDKNIDEKRKAC